MIVLLNGAEIKKPDEPDHLCGAATDRFRGWLRVHQSIHGLVKIAKVIPMEKAMNMA
jgi:hypothetical protein